MAGLRYCIAYKIEDSPWYADLTRSVASTVVTNIVHMIVKFHCCKKSFRLLLLIVLSFLQLFDGFIKVRFIQSILFFIELFIFFISQLFSNFSRYFPRIL